MSKTVDLDVLKRARSVEIPPPRRRWAWRLAPVLLVAALVAVLWGDVRDRFRDPVWVKIVRPQALGEQASSSGGVLFQAAGWVEPDPFAVTVTSLADGVVEEMLVEEGDVVKAGDPVARLVDDDALIELERAKALVQRKEELLRRRRAELATARASFEEALAVTEAVELARGELRRHRAHHLVNKAALREKVAEVKIAELEVETQTLLEEAGVDGPWQKELALAKLEASRAGIERLEAEAERADGQVDSARAKLKRAEGELEHRFDERLAIAVAEAELGHEEADALIAAQDLAGARLLMERMVVRAPMDGVVLERFATPGAVVGRAPEASPLCSLYDPGELRIRVDVPQGQVSRASRGQRAEIRSDARRGAVYEGEVLRIIDRADIQKVTLEVQVRVMDPDGLLKPEMLCQVSVFGPDDATKDEKRTSMTVGVPAEAVRAGKVWLIDGATGRARRQAVTTGTAQNGMVPVMAGLNLTDKVIVDGQGALYGGARVRVREEGQ